MIVKVNRVQEYLGSTLSYLQIDGLNLGYGIEPGFNDPKIPGRTRIPAGRYPMRLRTHGGFHERYKNAKWMPPGLHRGMLEICDVPGFTDILFHVGNSKKDTLGCLCPGEEFIFDDGGFFVTNSRRTYLYCYPLIVDELKRGNPVWIDYIDPPGLLPTKGQNHELP